MNKYENATTGYIADVFAEEGIKFRVVSRDGGHEIIEAGFPIKNGPLARVSFINKGKNDVSVRLFSLLNDVSPERKPRVLEACNMINNEFRFLKVVMDNDNDVNIEYDCFRSTSNECIGAVCVDVFKAILHMMTDIYPFLMKALHTDNKLEFSKELFKESILDAMRRLLSEAGEEVSGDESPEELIVRFRAHHSDSQDEEDE